MLPPNKKCSCLSTIVTTKCFTRPGMQHLIFKAIFWKRSNPQIPVYQLIYICCRALKKTYLLLVLLHILLLVFLKFPWIWFLDKRPPDRISGKIKYCSWFLLMGYSGPHACTCTRARQKRVCWLGHSKCQIVPTQQSTKAQQSSFSGAERQIYFPKSVKKMQIVDFLAFLNWIC